MVICSVFFFCLAILVASFLFGNKIPPPHIRFWGILAGCILFLSSWSMFNYLVEKRPFTDYLLFRSKCEIFPIPLPDRFRTGEIGEVLKKNNRIEIGRLFEKGNFSPSQPFPRWNVVFLSVESWRSDAVQVMPQTLALIKSGIYLKNHLATSNGTLPCVYCLYSGLYPFPFEKISSGNNISSWISFMKKCGYLVKTFNSSRIDYQSIYQGFEQILGPESADYCQTTRLALDETLKELGNPGFHLIQAELYNTHLSYYYPPAYEIFKPAGSEKTDFMYSAPTKEKIEGMRNRYLNSNVFLDYLLQDFFAKVKEKGFDKNTVFVLFGDHGESFGEDGSLGHYTAPGIVQFRVPCAIWAPGLIPREILTPTQHLDIIPTLGHLLGFKWNNLPGKDVFRDENAELVNIDSATQKIILRRKETMSLFELNWFGELRWIVTTRNDFSIDPELAKLYDMENLPKLARLVREDTQAILKAFSYGQSPP
ncbi:MAG: sulfatase-like hydrolase/transferase [Candidatus Ozemobacteraceae bacterium]